MSKRHPVALLSAFIVVVLGCGKHTVHGSGLLLNVQPTPPSFAGAYDFELLEPARGTACLKKGDGFAAGSTTTYWVSGAAFDQLPRNSRSSQAIAAAAFKLIDETNADSIVMTRVVAESRSDDEICATVYGRAVRLKKAMPPQAIARDRGENKPDIQDDESEEGEANEEDAERSSGEDFE